MMQKRKMSNVIFILKIKKKIKIECSAKILRTIRNNMNSADKFIEVGDYHFNKDDISIVIYNELDF